MNIVTCDMVEDAQPDLSYTAVERIVAAANAQIARVAPCLAGGDPGLLAEAAQIAYQALCRAGSVDPWVESETAGAFSAKYRDGAFSANVFNAADEAALRALCTSATPRGLPMADFPPASRMEGLFTGSVRRCSWPF